jgi:hypothetical protein
MFIDKAEKKNFEMFLLALMSVTTQQQHYV